MPNVALQIMQFFTSSSAIQMPASDVFLDDRKKSIKSSASVTYEED
jgi:hypothetical protein